MSSTTSMQTNTRKSTKVQKIFTTLFPRRNFLEKREVVAAESHSILRAVPSRPGDHDDNSDNDDNSNNDDDIYGDDDDGSGICHKDQEWHLCKIFLAQVKFS